MARWCQCYPQPSQCPWLPQATVSKFPQGAPIAVRAVEVDGRGGVSNPAPNATASAGSPMPRGSATRGDPRGLGESISPREGPSNRHPIGPGADGVSRGNGDGTPDGGPETKGLGGEESPPLLQTIGRSKDLRSARIGAGRDARELEIRVPRPEFLSSSSAETPMSYDRRRGTGGRS